MHTIIEACGGYWATSISSVYDVKVCLVTRDMKRVLYKIKLCVVAFTEYTQTKGALFWDGNLSLREKQEYIGADIKDNICNIARVYARHHTGWRLEVYEPLLTYSVYTVLY